MDNTSSKDVSFEQAEGYRYVEGGVCAAKGYQAGGLNCGLNPVKEKNDLALLISDTPARAAAVYTTNKVKGAPILVCQEHLKKTGNMARAVIANSKNANTCNADGVEKAEKMCHLAADALQIAPEEVLVASTGVIGEILPIEPIESHIGALAKGLSASGNLEAAKAIMTTDTVKKEAAVEFELDGKICRVGGMAKGSGMIHPNMGTMLCFLTTDCAISQGMLQEALEEVVRLTFNRISVDGDTSTNDTCCVLANGLAGNEPITAKGPDYDAFLAALRALCTELAKKMASDGEGARHLITCTVQGAKSEKSAETIAKSVVSSTLTKAAIFGADANWGRVLCAMGYSGEKFDPEKVDVSFASEAGEILVFRAGRGLDFDEELAKKILTEDEVDIDIAMAEGDESCTCWGCDITYDYIKINGDYRT